MCAALLRHHPRASRRNGDDTDTPPNPSAVPDVSWRLLAVVFQVRPKLCTTLHRLPLPAEVSRPVRTVRRGGGECKLRCPAFELTDPHHVRTPACCVLLQLRMGSKVRHQVWLGFRRVSRRAQSLPLKVRMHACVFDLCKASRHTQRPSRAGLDPRLLLLTPGVERLCACIAMRSS